MDTQNIDPSAALPEPQDSGISLADFFVVLWKHRKLIAGMTLLAAVASVGVMALTLVLPVEKNFLPNVYTPRAVMLIQSGSTDPLSAALSSTGLSTLASVSGMNIRGNPNGTLAQVLANSNTVLDALNRTFDFTTRYKVKKQPVSTTREKIRKHYAASFDDKTNLFTIAFTDTDPVFAKKVVDEAVRVLAENFEVLGGNRALTRKNLLEKKLAEVDTALRNLEDQLKAFQSKYGAIQVDSVAAEQVSILARLRSELILKEIEIANYEKVSRVEDPVIQQLRSQRAELLAKIRELESGSSGSTKLYPSQKELPSLAIEYARLQRDLAVQGELFKLLTQQYELAKLNAAGQEPVFQILEMAEVPDRKSGPSRATICIMTTMSAFVLSVLAAIVLQWLEKIRKDPIMIEKFRRASSRRGAA